MGSARIVVAAVVGDTGRVAVVALCVAGWPGGLAVYGEWLGDVAPPVRALDRVGEIDVGGAGVDRLPGVRRHHGVGDDDLLAGDQRVVGGRVEVEVRPRPRPLPDVRVDLPVKFVAIFKVHRMI